MWSFFSKRMLVVIISLNASLNVAAHAVHASSIEFTDTLQFLAPDGSEVIMTPGTYTVELAERWLRITPTTGVRTDAVLVKATPLTQEQTLGVSRLSLEQGPDNLVSLRLLLPDGQGWEAQGMETLIRSRGFRRIQRATRGRATSSKASKKFPMSKPALPYCTKKGMLDGELVSPTSYYWVLGSDFVSGTKLRHVGKINISQRPTQIIATQKKKSSFNVPVHFTAPIHLPQGAKIREIYAVVQDSHSDPREDLWLKLVQWQVGPTSQEAVQTIVETRSSCLGRGASHLIVDRINFQVDNKLGGLTLEAWWPVTSSLEKDHPKISLGPVRIGYTR